MGDYRFITDKLMLVQRGNRCVKETGLSRSAYLLISHAKKSSARMSCAFVWPDSFVYGSDLKVNKARVAQRSCTNGFRPVVH